MVVDVVDVHLDEVLTKVHVFVELLSIDVLLVDLPFPEKMLKSLEN